MGLFCWQHIMSLWTPSPLLPLRRQSLASLFKHWPPMPNSRAVCLNGDIAISGLFAVLILRNGIQPRGSRFYVTMWVCLEIEHTAAYPSYFFHVCGKCVENVWKSVENDRKFVGNGMDCFFWEKFNWRPWFFPTRVSKTTQPEWEINSTLYGVCSTFMCLLYMGVH